MPNYFYKATDLGGKWLTGEVHGGTREEAEAKLLGRGLVVESLDEAESPAPSARSLGSREELVELVEQLASLSRAGLPLPSGLRAAAREVASRRLRATFFELADLVESGGDLGGALEASGRRFPPHLRGLILAGSRSGRLAEVLGEYVRGAGLGSELRGVFLKTLAYPAAALAVVMAQAVFICSLSARAVETLVEPTANLVGNSQTGSAEALVAISRFVRDYGWDLLIGALAIPLLAWATYRLVMGPAGRRRLLCSIPVIGPVLRFASLAEFCHLLAMMIEADMPLPLAIELAGSGVRDADVAEASRKMGSAIEAGEPLSTAVDRWDSIPAGLGQLFQWSEGRRGLPEALRLAGEMFESRARSQSGFASSVLATLLLLLILWWIGFAIASLYLPLFTMINRLSG